MLELKDEPKRLVSTFLRYRNDVDIYTEDDLKDKEFYKILFRRLLEGKIAINDITPLGSKDNVIARCMSDPDNGRKKLFIIDGDIKFIHGQVPKTKNLFVLDAYCVENLLLNKNSIIHFIYLNCAIKSKEEIESELDLETWLTTYSEKLIDLFIHFAIVDFFGGRYTLYKAQKYHGLKEGKYVFNNELVTNDINALKNDALALTSDEEYNKKLVELRDEWKNTISNLLTIVSGKDYLIPILLIKTCDFKKSKSMPTIEEVKFSLAQFCDLDRFSKLKSALINL